ncbi:MAG TPA: bestrophin family ion channel [Pirellulaceae bacterium]|jgi:putative membrane protein|nr:bestrophin family ion channel [Pirellulaceae bacterium]
MIVKRRLTWMNQIFTWKGNVLRRIWKRLLSVFLVASAVTFLDWAFTPRDGAHASDAESVFAILFTLSELPFTMVGFALGIFLGFRNNESYQRFWEGRRLWGQLVNLCRTFARQVLTMIAEPEHSRAVDPGDDPLEPVDKSQRRLIYAMIGYVHSLRRHLRNDEAVDELSHWLEPAEVEVLRTQRNVPIRILQMIGLRLKTEFQGGRIDVIRFQELERTLAQATDVQGGCERIKATPLPFTYGQLTHTIVALYCYFLPFGIVDNTGWMTPLVTLFLAYVFLGLDCIGDELEDPFGTEPNDLPLSHISRNIEINLRQSLDEADVPEPLQPVGDVIW